MLLAAHLSTLTDGERRTLTQLVTAHQRTSDSALALHPSVGGGTDR
jgi:hypothetical protein